MRVGSLFLCVLVAATVACTDGASRDGAPTSDGPPAVVAIQSEAAYDSLPVMQLSDLGPLCRESADLCTRGGFPVAGVNGSGDVLFFGSANRQPQIYLVDSETARPMPVGRNGEGPGEYRFPWLAGFASDGELLVASPMERRFLRYANDGSPSATSVIPLPPGMFTAELVDGELRVLATELADERGDSMPVVMFAIDSGAPKARLVYETNLRAPSFAVDDMRPAPLPFAANPVWTIGLDGGILYSRSDRLVLDIYGPTGHHDHRVGFLVPPRQVEAGELAAKRASATRRISDPRMREALAAHMSREGSTHHPAITRIVDVGGPQNQIWVRESPMATNDSVSWVIFDRKGSAYARVVTGEDDTIYLAHGEAILMSTGIDPENPESLHWMRLEPK